MKRVKTVRTPFGYSIKVSGLQNTGPSRPSQNSK